MKKENLKNYYTNQSMIGVHSKDFGSGIMSTNYEKATQKILKCLPLSTFSLIIKYILFKSLHTFESSHFYDYLLP